MTNEKYKTKDLAGKVLDQVLEDCERGVRIAGDYIKDTVDSWYERISGLKEDAIFQDFHTSVKENASKGKEVVASKLEVLAEKYNTAQDARVEEKPKLTGIVDGFYEVFTAHPQRRSRRKDYVEGVGVGKALGTGISTYLFVSGGLISTVTGAVPAVIRVGPKITNYFKRKIEKAKEELNQE